MIKQNDVIEYTALHYGNAETFGRVEDVTVFVPQTIVGESAVVKVNYAKKGVAYADVVKVTKPSPHRVAPACKHFGKCGGCCLMHMDYGEQLAFKRNKVATNLRKLGGLDVDVSETFPSPLILGYRNKLSLPVGGKRGNVKIGMYRKNSHDVVDLDNCLLGGSWSNVLVKLFRNYLNRMGVQPYDEKTFSGEVRHLTARYVDGQLLVTVVSNGRFRHDLRPFAEELGKHFDRFGLFVNQNTKRNNVILGDVTDHVCGIKYIQTEHFGVKFRLQPTSFFQVNDGVKEAIYADAKRLLDLSATEVLVDCFSGVGVLTGAMVSQNYHTYAVEIVPSATQDAEEMKKLNNLENLTNICGDVNVELPKLAEKFCDKRMSLIVDPPRKGLGADVCQTVCNANISDVVYISCDSATLARDLKQLSSCYDVTYCRPYDMFPNTDSVETLVHLRRRASTAGGENQEIL